MAAPIYSVSKKRSSDRKNPANAEYEAKRRKATNALRPKQRWVESTGLGLSTEDLDKMTDKEILAIVPAHWERP
jgi:hypothetical protein